MGTSLSSCGFGFSHPALNSPWHKRLKPNYDCDCKMWHLASCHTLLYFCFAQVCVSVWAAVRTCLDLLFPVAAAITSSYREFLSFLPLVESVDWTCCWNGCQVGVLELLIICGFLQWCHLRSQNQHFLIFCDTILTVNKKENCQCNCLLPDASHDRNSKPELEQSLFSHLLFALC